MIQLFHGSAELGVEPSGQPVERLGFEFDNLLGITKLLKRAKRPWNRSG
jgi:hypothetical protein